MSNSPILRALVLFVLLWLFFEVVPFFHAFDFLPWARAKSSESADLSRRSAALKAVEEVVFIFL